MPFLLTFFLKKSTEDGEVDGVDAINKVVDATIYNSHHLEWRPGHKVRSHS